MKTNSSKTSAKTAARKPASAPKKSETTASRSVVKEVAAKAPVAVKKSTTSKTAKTTTVRAAKPKQSSQAHDDLHKIFVDTLKDIYWAEKHLVKGLNKMAKAAAHTELRAAFETHKAETEQQVTMLEQAFESLQIRAQGKRCAAMAGLLEEGEEHIEEYEKGAGRDAALIVGAQKIEHYEIAAYGSLRTFAGALGYPDCEQIFSTILDQESATDDKLTEVAQTVNQDALMVQEEEAMEA